VGFDFDPYRHIEVVQDEDESEKWHLHCHSCGAEKIGDFDVHTKLGELINRSQSHVRLSHQRTPEDFRGWSRM